jgi:hypothetical protein
VIVTWNRAFHAATYDVAFQRANGSRGLLRPKGAKRTVTITGVGRNAALRVVVTGLSATGRRGRAAKARLVPKRKPKKRTTRRG